MNPDFVKLMTTPFSSTTQLESIIFKISLIGAAQHYFKYYCYTLCGIPEVCIKGTVGDYEEIKRRLKDIGTIIGGLKWWTDKITKTIVACRRPGRNSLSLCTDYENIKGINAATSSQNRERHLQFPAR